MAGEARGAARAVGTADSEPHTGSPPLGLQAKIDSDGPQTKMRYCLRPCAAVHPLVNAQPTHPPPTHKLRLQPNHAVVPDQRLRLAHSCACSAGCRNLMVRPGSANDLR